MYKLTIEEVNRKVTIETEDLDFVKSILQTYKVATVDSEVPNRNVDPEWQELIQWYRKEIKKEGIQKISENAEIMDWLRISKEQEKQRIIPPSPMPSKPYIVHPDDPWISPFQVTC